MVALSMIFFVIGAALAGRYQFLVLGLVTFVGVGATIFYAHAAHLTAMNELLASLLAAISLQAGYLTGALLIGLGWPRVKAPVLVPVRRR